MKLDVLRMNYHLWTIFPHQLSDFELFPIGELGRSGGPGEPEVEVSQEWRWARSEGGLAKSKVSVIEIRHY